MNKSTILALVAGLVGGMATRYIAPPVAFAQDQSSAVKEVRAQSFVLTDESDQAVGTFTAESVRNTYGGKTFLLPNNGQALKIPKQVRIVLRDSNGRELWSAGGRGFLPLSAR